MMLFMPVPGAGRVWALPFLPVLALSERYHDQRQKTHKTITDWARQMIRQVHRWLPNRALVIVGDGSYAVVALLGNGIGVTHVSMGTRLRRDGALYDPAPKREAGKNSEGRPWVSA